MYLSMAATYCSSCWGDKVLLALDMIKYISDFDSFQYRSWYHNLFVEAKFIR